MSDTILEKSNLLYLNENKKSNYNNFENFLSKYRIKKNDIDKEITNTRMDTFIDEKGIKHYFGNFEIIGKDYDTFLDIYYNEIIINKKFDFLTEIQLKNDKAPLLIDIDLQYDYDTKERLFKKNDIEDIIKVYLNVLKSIHQFSMNDIIEIFVMTKPNINHVKKGEKKYVKDGIHIIIGLQCNHICQQYIRNKVIEKIKNDPIPLWINYPTKNTLEEVFDKRISTGECPWQLYGSKKKDRSEYSKNEIYSLSYIYKWEYNMEINDIMQIEIPVNNYELKKNFKKLSARYENHPPFYSNNFYEIEIENENKKLIEIENKKIKNIINNDDKIDKNNYFLDKNNKIFEPEYILQLNSIEELDKYIIDNFMNNKTVDSLIKEIIEYTLILPEKYWGDGSYELWIRVGWALYEENNSLFGIWVKFSSQSNNFIWKDVYDLYDKWKLFKKGGLTYRSIMYWAKKDAYEKFIQIKTEYNNNYVNNILENYDSLAHVDYANIVYNINKDKYVCVLGTKPIWYEFKNHRWCLDNSAASLCQFISEEFRNLFKKKTLELTTALIKYKNQDDEDDSNIKYLKKQINNLNNIVKKLGNTPDVKNIISFCSNKFKDDTFYDKLDSNCDLLCFNNGIIDLNNKIFREGYPHDYVSKCTNINYVDYNNLSSSLIEEINNYMNMNFPEPNLCKYMWEHLASSLSGKPITQTFHYYIGEGSNGKSVLTEHLMPNVLGDYMISPSISLVTEEMPNSGSANPQLAELKGVRYAIMQEPNKGKTLKEGIMKLISGGDNIKARSLYKDFITFKSQTSLGICANNFINILAQDEGTWRRIRAVPFISSFVDDPNPDNKYQFKKNPNLTNRVKEIEFSETFMSMLINIFFQTNGFIQDCDIVNKKSRQYRNEEDLMSQFIDDYIYEVDIHENNNCIIKQSDVLHYFSIFKQINGDTRKYSNKDLFKYISKKYPQNVEYIGRNNKTLQWKNLKIIDDN